MRAYLCVVIAACLCNHGVCFLTTMSTWRHVRVPGSGALPSRRTCYVPRYPGALQRYQRSVV